MVTIDTCTPCCVLFGAADSIPKLLSVDDSSEFQLDNKYYTVNVKLILSLFQTETNFFDYQPNAVIINGGLDEAKQITNYKSFINSDVRLFITKDENINSDAHEWAIKHQVEIINICDEPERIMEALSSSIWPGAKMKKPSKTEKPTENTEPRSSLEIDEELENLIDGDFASILNLVSNVRREGNNVSDQERRDNAEKVIRAISSFWDDDDL